MNMTDDPLLLMSFSLDENDRSQPTGAHQSLELEPAPIGHRNSVFLVPSIGRLPEYLTRHSDDYIRALSPYGNSGAISIPRNPPQRMMMPPPRGLPVRQPPNTGGSYQQQMRVFNGGWDSPAKPAINVSMRSDELDATSFVSLFDAEGPAPFPSNNFGAISNQNQMHVVSPQQGPQIIDMFDI